MTVRYTFKPGDAIGNYRVASPLGKGGMGEVWLLETPPGEERLAVKILNAEDSSKPEARRRFLREAELAMAVRHENIVGVYDVGQDAVTGCSYLIMEYVGGGSLSDRLKASGRLPIPEAVRILRALASALVEAKRHGIVHRDLKPGNIMFGDDGTPKLADLGIARGLADEEATTVTRNDAMIGTPAYMAPEQMIDAHNVDFRADLYSLGVVGFEMLVGERPNREDTVVQMMAKAISGETLPDVRKLRDEVSAELSGMIVRLCHPKPAKRPAGPEKVVEWCDRILAGEPIEEFKVKLQAIHRNPPSAAPAPATPAVAATKARLPSRYQAPEPPSARPAAASPAATKLGHGKFLFFLLVLAAAAVGYWFYLHHRDPLSQFWQFRSGVTITDSPE